MSGKETKDDSNYVKVSSNERAPKPNIISKVSKDSIKSPQKNSVSDFDSERIYDQQGATLRRKSSFVHKMSGGSLERKGSLWDEIHHGKDDKNEAVSMRAKPVKEVTNEAEEEDCTIRFEKPFYKMDGKTIRHYMKEFWLDGASNAITLLANVIGTTMIYVMIAQFDDALLQASYGLSMSYFFFIFIALNESSYEITSLTISKAHGAKQYSFLTTY